MYARHPMLKIVDSHSVRTSPYRPEMPHEARNPDFNVRTAIIDHICHVRGVPCILIKTPRGSCLHSPYGCRGCIGDVRPLEILWR